MAVWRVALSFPVFFTAAYRDNSVLLQGDAVNVLLVGDGTPDQMLGKDIVTRYISGKRPISRTTVSTLIKLDEETLMDRVSKSGIQDVILGAQCLSNLMQSEHIEIPAYAKNAIQEISYEDDPYRFIASCFLQAVRCPKDSLVPISKEMMEDILTCRAELSPSEQAAERTPEKLVTPKASDQSMQDADEADLLINTKTLPAVKGMATYRISGLNYEKEREKIKLLLLDGQDGNMKRQLTTKELYDSLEIMRVSA
ncbi:MAG: hypothetical protein IJ708_00305, partial [Clostridia bacterium]|nr:hypothetical protein [Clostridia bacterium]